MISRRKLIVVGAVIYWALALASFVGLIGGILDLLPHSLLRIALTVVGPAVLFAAGIDAWPLVSLVLALIAICLGLARLAWRMSPETEWFAFWLLCALLVWAGSPWLLWILAIERSTKARGASGPIKYKAGYSVGEAKSRIARRDSAASITGRVSPLGPCDHYYLSPSTPDRCTR